MILQTRPQGLFVPTHARLADDHDKPRRPALDLLNELLGQDPPEVTRIVMVTGEAGAGKTHVLQELVRQQALLYQRGRTDYLYLYINAQGRALARFNEALATELQDLRAVLTYHAVSALVRARLLVPIIDGFDELLGSGGYDDAFSSLTGFIEELDGEGQIVASARSTYYEQEFVARASSVSSLGAQAWTQVPLEVLPWEDAEFTEYVRRSSQSHGLEPEEVTALAARMNAIFAGNNAALRRKPLFVARTVDIVRREPEFTGGENLLRELVAAYLDRERREKLLDRTGGTLLTTSQMELLFKTLAEEMWNQETRELDRRSVREVAEFVLVTEGVSEAVQRVILERMAQLAFLVPGERSGGIAFEHEMFFSFFLAQILRESLEKDVASVGVFLSRSVLPMEVATTAITTIHDSLSLSELRNCQTLLDRLAEAGQVDTPRSSQIRENAGLVVSAVLKTSASKVRMSGLRVWQVVLPGGDLAEVCLHASRLEDVELRRVDLSSTRFLDCRAAGVLLNEVVVDPSMTRLELADLDVASQVLGLRVREHGLVKGIYDPAIMRHVLAACGAIAEPSAEEVATTMRSVPSAYKDLLERLARAYRRSNPVCTADNTLRGIFGAVRWGELEEHLLKSGIVTRETKSTRGRPKTFLRRQFFPEQIMAGADRAAIVPLEVRRFWDDLERGTSKH